MRPADRRRLASGETKVKRCVVWSGPVSALGSASRREAVAQFTIGRFSVRLKAWKSPGLRSGQVQSAFTGLVGARWK